MTSTVNPAVSPLLGVVEWPACRCGHAIHDHLLGEKRPCRYGREVGGGPCDCGGYHAKDVIDLALGDVTGNRRAKDTAQEIAETERVESYIRSIVWTDLGGSEYTIDEVRTLVAGNIRAFAAWERTQEPSTNAERLALFGRLESLHGELATVYEIIASQRIRLSTHEDADGTILNGKAQPVAPLLGVVSWPDCHCGHAIDRHHPNGSRRCSRYGCPCSQYLAADVVPTEA